MPSSIAVVSAMLAGDVVYTYARPLFWAPYYHWRRCLMEHARLKVE
jgi:hypothetical protein